MNLSVTFEAQLLPIEKGKRTRETYYVVARLNTGTIGVGHENLLKQDEPIDRLQIAMERALVHALQNGIQSIANQLIKETQDETKT